MKKFTLFLVLVGMITLQGCTTSDDRTVIDNDTISEVFQVTTNFTPQNGYSTFIPLHPPIFNSDVVLVYRLWGTDGGSPVWRLIPQTVYLPQGELDYNFDFTRFDVSLFLDSDFDLFFADSQWKLNQTFRIVLIPGYFGSARVDYSDYNKVMEMLGKNENDVKFL
jgi:hypothetical protein